jgi:hypothetical protein
MCYLQNVAGEFLKDEPTQCAGSASDVNVKRERFRQKDIASAARVLQPSPDASR